ncbi:MAG TPA: porin family protein [Gemmatimonadales bacterium]|nr:porin family protein [Gemmatimonadales bacterium]
MKRIGLAVLAAAGFTMAVARPVAAQSGTTLGVGVGLTLPMSDYGDKAVLGDKMGFHFGVGAGLALGSAPVRLRVEGSYTQTSHQEGVDGNTKLIGGMVSLVYPFSTAGSIKPYVLAGVGFYSTKLTIPSASVDTSKTSVGFGGGAGIRFPMSSMSLFVEARYLTQKAFDVTFARLPITVGVQFPLGGKK